MTTADILLELDQEIGRLQQARQLLQSFSKKSAVLDRRASKTLLAVSAKAPAAAVRRSPRSAPKADPVIRRKRK